MNNEDVEFRIVPIEPFRCLGDAKDLIAGRYWLFVGIAAVAYILAAMGPFGLLVGPMMCGLALCYFAQLRGETVKFDTLFKGFDFFIESLIVTLIIAAVSVAIILPVYMACFFTIFALGFRGAEAQPELFALSFFGMFLVVGLAVLLVMLVVGTLTAFVFPLMADRNMKAIPALKTGIRAAWAHLGGLLVLTILNGLITTMASLCCYLPLFLVLPITYGANVVAYRKVFPEPPPPVFTPQEEEDGPHE